MKNHQKKMTLAARLTIGLASVLVILLAVVSISLWQIQSLSSSIRSLITVDTPINLSTVTLLANVNRSAVHLRNWVITNDPKYKISRNNIWQMEIYPVYEQLKNLVKETRAKDIAAIEGLGTDLQTLKHSQDQIEATVNSKMDMKAINLTASSGNEILVNVNASIKKLLADEQSELQQKMTETQNSTYYLKISEWSMLIIALLLGSALAYRISRSITQPVNRIIDAMESLSSGKLIEEIELSGPAEIEALKNAINHQINTIKNITTIASAVSKGDYKVNIEKRSEDDTLMMALQEMTKTLRENKKFYKNKTWLQNGSNLLINKIADNADLKMLSNETLNEICRYLDAGIGALYLHDREKNGLTLFSSFAFVERESLANFYEFGSGIVGQVAIEQKPILLRNIKRSEMVISTAITEEPPLNIYTVPLLDKRELIGVITLGFTHEISKLKLEYLDQITSVLSSSLSVSEQRLITEKLLAEQKQLTEELQAQQEELKSANEELESQTEELKTSDEELRLRDEEQRTLNLELEERNAQLEKQKGALEDTKQTLVKKAEELEQTSKYKSEFLSNMSHELRTPLNSLLLLAKMMSENKEDNLSQDQLESLQVIHRSGQELLSLINDILDLAKVEAGKISIEIDQIDIPDLIKIVERDFAHIAKDKNITFTATIDRAFKTKIITSDAKRVKQIVNNLVANAIKFTESGFVKLMVVDPKSTPQFEQNDDFGRYAVAIKVTDSGIGIPEDQHSLVFQSFYQGDGSSKRKYGGTGLGLPISLKLAKLLNGDIVFTSSPNKGSCFTLFLPAVLTEATIPGVMSQTDAFSSPIQADFKKIITSQEETKASAASKKLLIVEDDLQFSKILMDVCSKKGFECLHAKNGHEAIKLAKDYRPIGILMDVNLPDISGIAVSEELKKSTHLANIPIHFISGDDKRKESMQAGAVSFLMKPITMEQLDNAIKNLKSAVNTHMKKVLVLEDDQQLQKTICKLINEKAEKVIGIGTAKEALDLLKTQDYDCLILDLGLPDMSGFDLLKLLSSDKQYHHPPVIIYTGRELNEEEHQLLQNYSNNIILKNNASMGRLLDETSLFLHSIEPKADDDIKTKLNISFDPKQQLKGKKILLVDDDIRNTFSLAKVLRSYDIEVLIAPHGKAAIDILNKEPDVSAVLMDIMMPIMDGFEAIEKIRSQPKFSNLPIIALTAKTMTSDRDRCLGCGATDYLTKPLDIDKLLISLRAWV